MPWFLSVLRSFYQFYLSVVSLVRSLFVYFVRYFCILYPLLHLFPYLSAVRAFFRSLCNSVFLSCSFPLHVCLSVIISVFLLLCAFFFIFPKTKPSKTKNDETTYNTLPCVSCLLKHSEPCTTV